ncbi:hypothetical protein F4811DRAFT_568160 [Daldinia bambusicola]|nr:hypothetical protein F4811DRAFT_568160 [Daldinia bambusicola]
MSSQGNPAAAGVCPTCHKQVKKLHEHVRSVHIGTQCFLVGCNFTTTTDDELRRHLDQAHVPVRQGQRYRCRWQSCTKDFIAITGANRCLYHHTYTQIAQPGPPPAAVPVAQQGAPAVAVPAFQQAAQPAAFPPVFGAPAPAPAPGLPPRAMSLPAAPIAAPFAVMPAFQHAAQMPGAAQLGYQAGPTNADLAGRLDAMGQLFAQQFDEINRHLQQGIMHVTNLVQDSLHRQQEEKKDEEKEEKAEEEQQPAAGPQSAAEAQPVAEDQPVQGEQESESDDDSDYVDEEEGEQDGPPAKRQKV